MWQQVRKLNLYIAAFFAIALYSSFSLAQAGPAKFNISGALYQANGTAITNPNVNFRIEVWNSPATCLLYSEVHSGEDLSLTRGGFSLAIGDGTSQSNPLEGTTAFSPKVFHNPGVVGPFSGCAGGVTLASGTERLLRVSYDLGSGYVAMTPDVPVTSAPYAMVADSLQGKSATDFILTNVNTQLSQNSMEYLFTNTNYTNLKALVDGTSTQYMVTSPGADVNFNSHKLVNVANPTNAQDASTKDYTDKYLGGQPVDMTGVAPGSGGNSVLTWDDVQNKWVARTFGSVSSITAGTGLNGGTIISAGTLSVDVGVTANKILQLNGSAQIPAVDGSLLSNVNATKLWARDVSSVAPTAGQVLTWNTSGSQWEAATPSGGTITALVGDVTASGSGSVTATISNDTINAAKINSTGIAKNLLLITDSTTGAGVGYMSCGLGQVLQWDANGWGCVDMSVAMGASGVTAGTYGSDTMVPRVTVDAQGRVTALTNVNIAFPVTTVAGRTGAVTLIASDIGGLGTAALVNVGTGSSNVPQLDAAGRMPAVDGSQLTNLTAGSMNGVVAGTGLTGGTITTYGTLSVDVGTTAGKIVQLTGAAQLPAVDGNLVTNVNAVKLQARDVSATAPGGGQVLGWNAANNIWEPMSTAVGSVTTVASGTGLVGGPITSNGTLSVDVGTGPSQIVQLDGSSKLPAVDGSALSNLNASRIGTRAIATSAPSPGQYIGWNNSTSQWEPMATTVGTVTNVATGPGLLGGPISSSGTLSVDVGTGANQIMQLTAGSQIPAVDGNLVTNINAVKLQARDVSATAPGGGQVLGWNATTSIWEPIFVSNGTVIQISSGTGLLGGPISSFGTLSVDVGTTSGKILQLNANAQIPAVDGYLITNINAFRNGGNTFGSNSSIGNTDSYNLSFLTGGSPRMVIDTSGYVGIGTGTPTARLTVNGNIAFPDGSGTAYTMGTTGWDDTATLRLSRFVTIQADSPNTILYSSYNYHRFVANSVNLLEMDRSGNGALFSIGGVSRTNVSPVTNTIITARNASPGVTGDDLVITTGPGTHTRAGSITMQPGVPDGWNGATDITGAPMYLGGGTSKGNQDGGPIYFRTTPAGASGFQMNPYVTAMTIAGNGSVGIGTETPNALLDVAGILRVTTICDSSGANCKTVSGGWGAGGSVTNVSAGIGLMGGDISTAGTLNVDVGTTSGKILQLSANAQIPAVDGNLVTNINAVKLQTRDIAATAPAGGQVLSWNSGTSIWEPSSVTSGTVTTVSSGNGLLGGPISNNGTLSVDVGTTSNKILQLTADAQIPAVDGNLVTNVNAVKLQTRDVAATAPTSGQVLAWNGLSNVWEPTLATAGSVTSVQTGIGLIGGPITSTGTVSVDVGTTSGKILQLNASAQIPAVDGSLITNINAFRNGGNVFGASSSLGNMDSYDLTFLTNNNVRMTVASGGNVGIGTTNPSAPLEVAGSIITTGTSLIGGASGQNFTLRRNVDDNVLALSGGNTSTTGANIRLFGSTHATAPNVFTFNNSGSEAMRITAAGNVGIGTANPSNKLQVASDLTFGTYGDDGQGLFSGASNPNKGVTIGFDTTANYGWISARVKGTSSNPLILNGAGGAVAIGSTSVPFSSKLTVNGSTSTSENSPVAFLQQDFGASAFGWGLAVGRNGSSIVAALALGADTSNNAMIAANTTDLRIGNQTSGTFTEQLRVAASGNVGIGTTTPQTVLDISSTTSGQSAIIVPRDTTANRPPTGVNGMIRYNTSNSSLESFVNGGWQPLAGAGASYLPLSGGTMSGPILQANGTASAPSYSFSSSTGTGVYSSATDKLSFATAGAQRVTIDQLGNVGIGTTTPANSLSVVAATGSTAIASFSQSEPNGLANFKIGNSAPASTSNEVRLPLQANTSTTTRSIGGLQAHFTDTTDATRTGQLDFAVASNGSYVPRMSIVGSSVGIGTTTPQTVLDISSTTSGQSAIIVPRDTTANRPPTGVNGMIRYNTSNSSLESFVNGGWQSLAGAGASYLPLSGGTMTGAILQANGTAGAPSYSFSSSTGTGVYSSATDKLSFATAGAQRVTIDQLGNVGIGTTTPASLLQVGDIGGFSFGVAPVGSFDGMVGVSFGTDMRVAMSPNGNSVGWPGAMGMPGIRIGLNPNYSYLVSDASGNLMINGATGGKVGIGTTTPQAALDISSTTSGQSAIIVPRDTTANRPPTGVNGMIRYNTSNSSLESFVNGGWQPLAGAGASYLPLSGGTMSGPILQANGTASAPSYSFSSSTGTGVYSSATDKLSFATAGAQRVTIDQLGNVGIGTTTPAAPLTISQTNGGSDQFAIYVNGKKDFNFVGNGQAVDIPITFNNLGNGNARIGLENAVYLQYTSNCGSTGCGVGLPEGKYFGFWNGTSNNSATDGYLTAPGSGLFAIGSNSLEAIRIDASQRVGIGTTTPQALLDLSTSTSGLSAIIVPRDTTANRPPAGVNGMIRYNTTNAALEAYTAGSWNSLATGAAASSTGNNGALQISNGSGGFLSNNNVVVNSTTGFVGIGTASPTAPLSIAFSSDQPNFSGHTPVFTLANENTTAGWPTRLSIMSGSSNATGTLFQNEYNVGLGGYAPSSYLLLAGSGEIGLGGYGGYGGGSQTTMINWMDFAGTKTVAVLQNSWPSNVSPFMIYGGTAIGTFAGSVTAPTDGLLVSGKVGIGTATPSVSLDVSGNTDAIRLPAGTTAQRPGTPANGMIRYNSDSSSFESYANGTWDALGSGSGPWNTGPASSINYTAGNVGIGTPTPNQKLEVNGTSLLSDWQIGSTYIMGKGVGNRTIAGGGTSAGAKLILLSASQSWSGPASESGAQGRVTLGNSVMEYTSASGADHTFYTKDSPGGTWNEVALMTIKSSGNVGIGTSTPRTILEITSSTADQSAIILPRDTQANRPTTGVNGMIRYNTSTGAFEGFANSTWSSLGSGGSGQWNTGTASSINYTAGNVGIGTATPMDLLSIAKDQDAVSRLDLYNSNAGSSSASNFRLRSDVATINFQANSSTWSSGNYYDGLALGTAIWTGNTATGGLTLAVKSSAAPIRFASPGGEKMRIDGLGKVGIGTVSPASRLEVSSTTEQLRLAYSPSVYWSSTVDAAGSIYLAPNTSTGSFAAGVGATVGQNAVSLGNSSSGGYFGTAVGFSAVANGSDSAAFGREASSSGGESLALGYASQASAIYAAALTPVSIASGSYSVAIGYASNTASFTESVAIGRGATVTKANQIVLGRSSESTYIPGNVGIGTPTPNYKLDVVGSLNASAIYVGGQLVDLGNINGTPSTSGGGVQTIRQTATNAATNFRSALILRNDGTGGNYELNLTGQNSSGTITSAIRADGGAYFAGRVGIGTPSPVAPLHILEGINSNIFLGTSTSNAGEHQIGFGFHTLNSVAAAIVGKSTTTNGRGNLEFRVAAGGDGTSATSSDTVLRLQPTIAEVLQPLSVRSITIDGTSSTNKRIQVGTDLPTPDDSTLLIKAGDAIYGDRGGGNLILSSGGNAGAGSGVDGYVAIRTSQSVAPSSSTNATAEVARFLGSGNVGIGTTTPNAKLEVVGTIYSRPNPTSGATINLALSNTHLVTSVGGSAITLQNMTHGGQYTIIVQDTTSRQYTFTGCDSSYFKPANAATVDGKHTIYGIITVKSGANWICYISWSSDFG